MKYVILELNYSRKQYEYKTLLDLKVGHTYRIEVADGWAPPMRVKVISVSNKQTFAGNVEMIISATEAEEGI